MQINVIFQDVGDPLQLFETFERWKLFIIYGVFRLLLNIFPRNGYCYSFHPVRCHIPSIVVFINIKSQLPFFLNNRKGFFGLLEECVSEFTLEKGI